MADLTVRDSNRIDERGEKRIDAAKAFAKRFHEGQVRRGGSGFVPYYDEHVLGVYHILRDECGIEDEDILIIALLHDTVEDTACTYEDIEKEFGADIRTQVQLLTRITGEPFSAYAGRLFANGSYRAILVKLADRLHNLRTIIYMPDITWIQKKVKQSYTDILNPLPDAIKRITQDVDGYDGAYNDVMKQLADKIEEQLLVVQQSLNLR